jgi:assimilatory nitrate reductase catalytic subunit
MMLARVQISEDQRLGSIFVPMHWSDAYAKSARADALVAPITDPISGQPESKHTPVRIEAYRPAWQGFVLSRDRLEFPDISYCACTKGQGYWRHEIAGEVVPESWGDWVQNVLGQSENLTEYRDAAMGRYRAACIKEGQLAAVFFIARDQRLPEREWLASLFKPSQLTAEEIAGLLAARAPGGADTGRVVCACFSVGEKTILHAIQSQGLKTVAAVSQCLKAGSNCGSCVPEIRQILEAQSHA